MCRRVGSKALIVESFATVVHCNRQSPERQACALLLSVMQPRQVFQIIRLSRV